MDKNKNLDFVAIGDVTTDAFIRLSEASVHCEIDRDKCQICMSFKDKVPYEFVKVVPAVGNSANAAVAAARLGLSSALVSNIGNDNNGKDCLSVIEKEGVLSSFIKVNEGLNTNYHFVLWYDSDRTILVKHENFAYELPDIGSPKWVYLSSLGENSLSLHDSLTAYLDNHKETSLAFQPGTYQMKFGKERLSGIYQRTEVFISNREEAQRILGTKEDDILKLSMGINSLGPKTVIITDGPEGAYMLNENILWFIPPYPDEKLPYERTGAGDAFSSTFVSALALGLSPLEALRWGPVNGMSVVQYIGAREGLLSRDKLEGYLAKLPEYKAKKYESQ